MCTGTTSTHVGPVPAFKPINQNSLLINTHKPLGADKLERSCLVISRLVWRSETKRPFPHVRKVRTTSIIPSGAVCVNKALRYAVYFLESRLLHTRVPPLA